MGSFADKYPNGYMCLRCRNMITHDDLGQLSCRQHPLPYNTRSRGNHYGPNQYDCCGVSMDVLHPCYDMMSLHGCTPCDHLPPDYQGMYGHLPTPAQKYYVYDAVDDVLVKPQYASGFAIYERSFFTNPARTIGRILRYDIRITKARIASGMPYPETPSRGQKRVGRFVMYPYAHERNERLLVTDNNNNNNNSNGGDTAVNQ